MNLLLLQLILILFMLSQCSTGFNSFSRVCLTSFSSKLSNLHVRVESSANKLNLKKSLQLGKSLIKIRNRRGPKIDPCGTPCDKGRIDEEVLFTETYCLRSDKYDWNHLFGIPLIP